MPDPPNAQRSGWHRAYRRVQPLRPSTRSESSSPWRGPPRPYRPRHLLAPSPGPAGPNQRPAAGRAAACARAARPVRGLARAGIDSDRLCQFQEPLAASSPSEMARASRHARYDERLRPDLRPLSNWKTRRAACHAFDVRRCPSRRGMRPHRGPDRFC